MKGTELFKSCIKQYLDARAERDELFRAKYETTERTIEDIVNYILNEVHKSGCNGFADEEIYSMAVHVIDEPDIEIGKPIMGRVIVNHHVELTEEEKAEERAKALRAYQQEEIQRLKAKNQKPAKTKTFNEQPTLFDF